MGKWSRPCRAASVLPNTSASRWTSASVWQTTMTCWPAPAASSSSRTLLMSPLNRSTDSIFSRHVASSESAATAEAVTDGNRNTWRSVSETWWTSSGRSSRSR